MAITVTAAFNKFLNHEVNLDPDITKAARASRDWLISKIYSFNQDNDRFPLLHSPKAN